MNTFKALAFDITIIILFLVGIAGYCFDIHFNTYRMIVGICYAMLFSASIKNTAIYFKKVRYKAIEMSFNFMIGFLTALKIVEIARNLTLQVDPLTVVLTGVCLQSVYYAIIYIVRLRHSHTS